MSNKCYHCGDKIIGKPINLEDKLFCCDGCKTVYTILNENHLDDFYAIKDAGGVKPDVKNTSKYALLDTPEIKERFLNFQDNDIYIVSFFIPAIHCSSCIYLLENISKLDQDIIKSETNFTAQSCQLTIKKEKSLAKVAELLSKIGYSPDLQPISDKNQKENRHKKLLLQLGVAGFGFGSVMLWTFPDYFGLEKDMEFVFFRNFSAYLTLLVAIPVLLYSAKDYFTSAYKALKTKQLNLDIPIAIGIFVLFTKSAVSIILQEGPGYMDSFTGFVFLLLIGKWFQAKTYQNLRFDNDPKSYFPLGVHRIKNNGNEEVVIIDKLKKGDTIAIHPDEIIPCDVKLISPEASIDTSFITGESRPITIKKQDKIYAGSKLIGDLVYAKVVQTTARSKFAEIWNYSATKQNEEEQLEDEGKLTKFFLTAVFILAISGGIIWYFIDPSQIIEVVVAVLVVACPCALALSFPFVYGNAMRKFGRHGIYFKNTAIVKRLHLVDTIIFDKTGTLTSDKSIDIQCSKELNQQQVDGLYALTRNSAHPYSKGIHQSLEYKIENRIEVKNFKETPGKGIEGHIKGKLWRLGSAKLINARKENDNYTYLEIGGNTVAYFSFESKLREGVRTVIQNLADANYKLALLSGDNEKDAKLFEELKDITLKFRQTPASKKQYVEQLKSEGSTTLFIGDGLNDSVALKTADIGVSVAEAIFHFTPSSDAIIQGENIKKVDRFIKFGTYTQNALNVCLVFSLLYNITGVTFALLGYVTPLFAAILMPLSSITIVLLSTLQIRLYKI